MTDKAIIPQQPVTIAAILNKAQAGQRSIADHDIAIRRPLAELVEATITASCKSPHTARNYHRRCSDLTPLPKLSFLLPFMLICTRQGATIEKV